MDSRRRFTKPEPLAPGDRVTRGMRQDDAAMLMGAASADLPTIMVTSGPMLRGMFGIEEVGSRTDLWR